MSTFLKSLIPLQMRKRIRKLARTKRYPRFLLFFNFLKDKLGIPVSHTSSEFRLMKRVATSSIDLVRSKLLANHFNYSEDEVIQYIKEAKELCIFYENIFGVKKAGVGGWLGGRDSTTLYTLIRLKKPELVIETGTAAGGSSTFILHALERNNSGKLITMDLSKRKEKMGYLIPDSLRHRVEILYGSSLDLLPELFKRIPLIDFFFHDSLHKYHHMMTEYELILTHLKHEGILSSHDILYSNAWKHFTKKYHLSSITIGDNFAASMYKKSQI